MREDLYEAWKESRAVFEREANRLGKEATDEIKELMRQTGELSEGEFLLLLLCELRALRKLLGPKYPGSTY